MNTSSRNQEAEAVMAFAERVLRRIERHPPGLRLMCGVAVKDILDELSATVNR